MNIHSSFPLSYKFSFLSSAVIVLALTASLAICYFTTPTVFGGRDQGAIATAAINLVKHKSFTFSTPVSRDLFQKYGPGKALNYPGFDYTKDRKLVSRFPKTYIVYLAGCYWLFGLKGIQFANFIPLFLFFILFWLTLREFFDDKVYFLGYLLAMTFFPFLWFAKYALTEIFMLFLVWTGVYFLILYKKSASIRYLQIALIALALSALTRIEGIIFFLLDIFYIFLLQRKKVLQKLKNFTKYLIIATIILITIYFFLNFPALLDSLKNIAKAFLPNSTKDSAPSVNLYSRLFILFLNYNLLIYVILGIAGIFWLAKNFRSNWIKPEFIPLLILFPSFFYFISPMITLDDPWIFRRFVFAVFPTLIFYSIHFLNRYGKNKAFVWAIFIALAASNLVITSRYFTYSENKNLLPQVESLSKKFGDNDLLLVDRLAAGSGFALLSEPLASLFGKNAVYFFNANDLNFIQKNNYKNIYLIAPLDAKQAWYDNLNKELIDMIPINNNHLKESSGFFSLAQNVEATMQNGIWKLKI